MGAKILWYTSAKGRMLGDKMKDEKRKSFAEDGESAFSVSYFLRERANKSIEREVRPVKKWDVKEVKAVMSIRYMYLGFGEVRCFKKKYMDARKNT